MNKRILTVMCSCGKVISTLKVTGDIQDGVVTTPQGCWRCREKQSFREKRNRIFNKQTPR